MIDLSQIVKAYPEYLHDEREFLLREYLQYEILAILFTSKFAHRYTFLGGTCLRICYGTDRFSEDLDFDNQDITVSEFEETARIIQRQLELRGFRVELRLAFKGAYHCSIKFPGLLYGYELSGHREAKLFIKMDTEKQQYHYHRELIPINLAGIGTEVPAVPLSLLASQKVAAIVGRKRPKGRDFYDLAWCLARTTPDYGYLDERFRVSSATQLRNFLQRTIEAFDFDLLAEDVRPFLFHLEDVEAIRAFPTYWRSVEL
ncbi:nucleotidyltransferase AbiEii toxin of type IV toxin-antitoxin system [Neolewinella xylanilytica]|uniref:Nucleotidyltransferase AbiEii toxin of type IV toxin-antitoxin system n=1 Tax=Neolewinella xylanilytica TaxID=1514080 RepID=A0A2S6I3X5_9BACT|nr:nucleotidyl transferase AbiEii/AbiGii toxin family protein [Neolewinella xylanilytica]PPK85761.1 nucleotidyltransferase AbiEii toxin of type IV toxin-antitoxin system [Neolewinella xylanilytica]